MTAVCGGQVQVSEKRVLVAGVEDIADCYRGNVYFERLWRSIRHEEIYPHACGSNAEVDFGIIINGKFYDTVFENRLRHGS